MDDLTALSHLTGMTPDALERLFAETHTAVASEVTAEDVAAFERDMAEGFGAPAEMAPADVEAMFLHLGA